MIDEPTRWRNGGTFLTNFDDKDRPIYEAAIKAHGDSGFFISKPEPPMTTGASLHYSGGQRDLADFWKVWKHIQRTGAGRGDSNESLAGSSPSSL